MFDRYTKATPLEEALQFFNGQFRVTQNRLHQAWPNCLAGMHWSGCRSAIGMF
jgi:hypothetical protein